LELFAPENSNAGGPRHIDRAADVGMPTLGKTPPIRAAPPVIDVDETEKGGFLPQNGRFKGRMDPPLE
jgi:hypothetical protein